jgi:hypothetical protein
VVKHKRNIKGNLALRKADLKPDFKPLEFRGEPVQHLAGCGLPCADARAIKHMSKINKLCFLLLLPVILAGCTSITNLTPTQYPRDSSGYYRVEAMWKSRREVIRPGTFKPVVVVEFQTYPMRPVPLVSDRWEAYIPIPADKDFVHYHYKFDFQDDVFGGKPKGDSLNSAPYQLHIK